MYCVARTLYCDVRHINTEFADIVDSKAATGDYVYGAPHRAALNYTASALHCTELHYTALLISEQDCT